MRWLARAPAGATLLDLACGSGRHARAARACGLEVTAVDRDADALAGLASPGIETRLADLEGAAWPLAGRRFDIVLVTHYLHRPLFDAIVDSVAPDGLLIYETFADGQQVYGRPHRAEFLLQAGELLRRVDGLRVLGFEDGVADGNHGVMRVQRIAATRLGSEPRTALECWGL
ncbi:class I SAM-dependent methyltransferase [soil metagenome]